MKPVSSRHITLLVWTLVALATITFAAPAPAENLAQNERADSKIDDLRDKIQKLQVLLEQYAKAKANQNPGTESGNAPAPAVDQASVVKEPMTSSHKARDDAGETMAKLISQLNRKDVWILKKLVETLDRLDDEQSQGVFQEHSVPESQEGIPKDLKDKVARVLNEHKQFYKSQIEYSPESRLSRTQKDPVQTDEGTFGQFAKDEAQLPAVERKLIEDLNKAVKEGYTIEDIIRDLEDRKAAKQEHEKRRTQEERELAALLDRTGGRTE